MAIKDKRYVAIVNAKIKNLTPLHIGTDGDELLILHEENKAYLPSTTISGSFRAYLRDIYDNEVTNGIFGEGKNESKIYVYDADSDLKSKEVRPGIRINKHSGSNDRGGKFNREYIGAFHEFNLKFEIFGKDEEEGERNKQYIYECLNALNKAHIALGAYTTSGAGIFSVEGIETCSYDFSNMKELMSYLKEEKSNARKLSKHDIDKGIFVKSENSNFIDFTIKGNLETPLLVKGQNSLDYERPDGENIRNAQGEYIIPGTSIKGVIRAQSEKILDYLQKTFFAEEIFGTESKKNELTNNNIKQNNLQKTNSKEKNKLPCRVYVSDVIIENPINENGEVIYNRIKIDKFTGGVMTGGVIKEEPILGEVAINVRLKKISKDGSKEEQAKNDAITGLLSLALRDLCIGDVLLGSGYSIGRGKLNINIMEIKEGDKLVSTINFKEKSMSNKETLNAYIKTLQTLNL